MSHHIDVYEEGCTCEKNCGEFWGDVKEVEASYPFKTECPKPGIIGS